MVDTIPSQAKKYFWGDDLSQLNWQDHKKYIVQPLLNKGDEESISWILKRAGTAQIKKMMPQLKLDPKSENFWKVYLS